MISNSRRNILSSSVLVYLFLFFTTLAIVACTINSKNQSDFNLQQMGIESLVERHSFALEGSKVPQLQPLGDTFRYNNHVYAIKQPGQFVFGAIAYAVLHALGWSYLDTFTVTASLVTLLTSGVFAALSAMCVYAVSFRITKRLRASIGIALFSVIGTIFLPYAGVAHHDVYATALLCIGWSLLVLSSQQKKRFVSLIAGVCIGLSLFVSLLPLLLCLTVFLYVLYTKKIDDILLFGFGVLIGVLPLFICNAIQFGHPFTTANTFSGTTDTNPFLSVKNMQEKLHYYLLSPSNSIFVFSPLFFFAIAGLFFFPKKHRTESVFIAIGFVIHILYLSSIETVGHAQYGPRYMLPLLPFLSLGLVGIVNLLPKLPWIYEKMTQTLLVFLGLISIVICIVGALGGVMYQFTDQHPFPIYLHDLMQGTLPTTPLTLIGILLFCVALLTYSKISFDQMKQ